LAGDVRHIREIGAAELPEQLVLRRERLIAVLRCPGLTLCRVHRRSIEPGADGQRLAAAQALKTKAAGDQDARQRLVFGTGGFRDKASYLDVGLESPEMRARTEEGLADPQVHALALAVRQAADHRQQPGAVAALLDGEVLETLERGPDLVEHGFRHAASP